MSFIASAAAVRVGGKLAVLVITLAIAFTMMVAVLFNESPDETANGKCSTSDQAGQPQPSSDVAEGVPPGQRSLPMRSSDMKVSSQYREDRGGVPHRGIDFAGDDGVPIFAVAAGTVSRAGTASGFGSWIVLDHNVDGKVYSTVYGHMWNTDLVTAGQTVVAGQHIANVGSAGESSGPHLHLELHEGGWSAGPSDRDPNLWIAGAAEPGTAQSPQSSTSAAPAVPLPVSPVAATEGSELPALPASIGSEQGLQIDAIRVARAMHAKFPEITRMHLWREHDEFPDHPSGAAVDLMIPDYNSNSGRQFGDTIKDYLWTNRDQFNIVYLIWRQQSFPVDGEPSMMENRGGDTANHFDHIHITTEGGGYPADNQTYGPTPEPDDTDSAPTPSPQTSCDGSKLGESEGGGHLNDDAVPEEFVRWLHLSAKQCKELSPALLAAQIEAESGFIPNRISRAGAMGYTQFMPDTWAGFGYKVDDNGNRVGDAGSGDPNNIGDAVMAQGAYMCDVAATLRPHIESGKVSGDITELMLAGYNAGPGAVIGNAGIPPYSETTTYVAKITSRAKEMAAGLAA